MRRWLLLCTSCLSRGDRNVGRNAGFLRQRLGCRRLVILRGVLLFWLAVKSLLKIVEACFVPADQTLSSCCVAGAGRFLLYDSAYLHITDSNFFDWPVTTPLNGDGWVNSLLLRSKGLLGRG